MSQAAILILVVWVLLVVVALVVRQQWFAPRKRTKRSLGNVESYAKPVGKVGRGTQQALMTLLNGDRKTATRLLSDARFRYPGKSERWYWEKVIYDLKRDRRT